MNYSSNISTLSLANLTCIDHAYIDNQGRLFGRSFNAGFLVSGRVEQEENVVVDFSALKKKLKETIDGTYGFDHKLWLDKRYIKNTVNGRILIETRHLIADLPLDTYSTVNCDEIRNQTYLQEYISEIVLEELIQKSLIDQKLDLSLKCFLNQDALSIFDNQNIGYFNYSHGLRSSSSYGCQSPVHGHTSYIQLNGRELGTIPELQVLANEIALHLKNTIFIWRENVTEETQHHINVSYTCPRGYMSVGYEKIPEHKIVVLETETTVEYLIEYVKKTFYKQLKADRVKSMIVSEGLAKGSYVEI